MLWKASILLFSIFFVVSLSKSPDMVVVLSRHGAREPLKSNFDDSWKNPTYLMDVGVEQHYTLGSVLAKKYSHLLKDITAQEIYIQTTYSSRTHMSISAQLLGLFGGRSHKHQEQQNPEDFKFPYANDVLVNEVVKDLLGGSSPVPNGLQFLPQKTHSRYKEDLLQISPNNCQFVNKTQDERFQDEENKNIEVLLNDTFTELQALGYNVKDMSEMKEFGDTLASRYADNKPPLDGIPYNGKLYNDTVFGFKWWNIYNLMGDAYERALKVFPLYNVYTKWFTNKAQGKTPLKLVLLGGHESSMFPFLNLYNITNHTCFSENYRSQLDELPLPYPDCKMPEVASTLIYEFYNNSGSPYVRLLYNGKPFKLCRNSKGMQCDLDDFVNELPEVTFNLTQKKWDKVCATKKSGSSKSISNAIASMSSSGDEKILTIVIGLLGILIGLIIYLFLSKRMVLSNQYKGINQRSPTEIIHSTKAF